MRSNEISHHKIEALTHSRPPPKKALTGNISIWIRIWMHATTIPATLEVFSKKTMMHSFFCLDYNEQWGRCSYGRSENAERKEGIRIHRDFFCRFSNC